MKKLILTILLIVISIPCSMLSFSHPTTIAYATNTSENNKNSYNIDEALDNILNGLDLSEYDNFLNSLKIINENYSIKQLIESLLKNDFELDFKYLLSYICSCFLGNIKHLIIQMFFIIFICVLMSLLQNLTSNFANASTKKIVYISCYGTIITIISLMITNVISETTKTLNYITSFSNIVFPIALMLMTAIGATASATVYQPIILIFSTILIKIINFIIMPLFYICLVFAIISNLSDDIKLEKISVFAKSAGDWILGLIFGIFLTYTTAQGITGAGIDNLAIRGSKYLLGNYVPIIGNYLKEGFDIITTGCIVIKNAFGFVSIIILLLVCLVPLLKTLSLMLIIKLTAAITEPFADKKIVTMLCSVSKCLNMLILINICLTLSLIIIIMLIICTGNPGGV